MCDRATFHDRSDPLKYDARSQTRIDRRSVLFAGVAIAAVATRAAARVYVPMFGKGVQGSWRFCEKCFSLFFNGNGLGFNGVCPAGGQHVPQGWEFQLYYDSDFVQPAPGRDSQFYWRFCEKCFTLFYDPHLADGDGVCPVVSRDTTFPTRHFARGFYFGLPHDNPANSGQADWRFCQKCWGLFFDDPGNRFKGACPAGGAHVRAANSFNFQLDHTSNWLNGAPAQPNQLGFRMQFQQSSNWCWIAVATSINHYYHPNSTWTQCQVMSLIGQDINGYERWTSGCPSAPMVSTNTVLSAALANPYSRDAQYILDQPIYAVDSRFLKTGGVTDPLKVMGNLNGYYGPGLSLQKISAEINARRPVCVDITWNNGTGSHVVVIAGVTGSNLTILDPAAGQSTISFSAFPSSYRVGATLNGYAFTKA